jgi:tripartite-type tricarboxylate transporter receptor subunit TctC
MNRRSLLGFACLATLACAAALPLNAQVGGQPIRIVFPFAAGGSGDALARLIAETLAAT